MTVMLDELDKQILINEKEYLYYMDSFERYNELTILGNTDSIDDDDFTPEEKREIKNLNSCIYRSENKAKYRNYVKNYKLLKRTNGTGVSVEQWEEILVKFNRRCAYCGVTAEGTKQKYLTQEHIIAISNGGEHSPYNVVPACQSCNSSKQDRLSYKKPKVYIKKGVTEKL